ncbi:MAG: site-specific integrase [Micrococcales bacterium]|nr:site-specific integrase [Micrococcales bacterium]
MASIIRREVGGKPRYDVKYREPDGRQRKKTFTRRADADTFAATVEADKIRGSYIDPDAGKVTFAEYAEEWLSIQTSSPQNRALIARRLRLHVLPVLGRKQIGRIRPTTIQAWMSGLSGSSGTKRQILGHVSAILDAAVADERITKNPTKSKTVARPKQRKVKIKPWTTEQVGAVRAGLEEHYRIALDLGAGLGLRQGEIMGLSPGDVDFLRGWVTVRRQVISFKGRRLYALPKHGVIRTVPLPSSLRGLLAAYLAAHPTNEVTLPWGDVDGDSKTFSLVLTNDRTHAAMWPEGLNVRWRRAVAAAGMLVGTRENQERNGMHALRHHYASVLLDAGENIRALADYLGHADPGFTLRVYAHLMPSSAERTRIAVDDAFVRYMAGPSEAREASEQPLTCTDAASA